MLLSVYHAAPTGRGVEYTVVADLIPEVGDAIDVCCRDLAGRDADEADYVIGSDCGHLQLTLQVTRETLLSWGRQRAMDVAPAAHQRGGQRAQRYPRPHRDCDQV